MNWEHFVLIVAHCQLVNNARCGGGGAVTKARPFLFVIRLFRSLRVQRRLEPEDPQSASSI